MNYNIRFNNSSSCKRFMQRILNEVYDDKIDLEKAKVLNQLVKTMLDCIDKADIEGKIEELEKLVGEMQNENK